MVKKGQWSGYDYNVVNGISRKGATQIRIIGDKKGGISSKRLLENRELLRKLEQVIQLPLKFIFITRNPFDNIATRVIRESRISQPYKVEEIHLKKLIDNYFKTCDLTNELINDENYDVHVVGIEQFIKSPLKELEKLFEWLGISCEKHLLEKLASKFNKTESKTRLKIEWRDDIIDEVLNRVNDYSYLKNYSFD